jgi:hypothetical protein
MGLFGAMISYCLDCSAKMILEARIEVFTKIFLVLLVVIYSVWSLIQKKK